jgi:PIN domain nuclease of toxin-antitoxin system
VSAVSAYEIIYKHSRGKLSDADPLAGRLTEWMAEQGFRRLNISIEHALAAARLDWLHRDPWDRILVARRWSRRSR